MKLYLSGPMTGLPEFNYPAFHEAAAKLRAAGHEVISPAELDGDMSYEAIAAVSWEDFLRRDLRLLLDCEGMALLPGSEESRGAMFEWDVANRLSMPIRTVDSWL